MTFIDPVFLFIFLPTTLLIFYLVLLVFGKNESLLVLFISSIIFYIPYGIFSTILLLAALFINFIIAFLVLRMEDNHPHRTHLYSFGQIYNITTLFYFKYKIITLFFSVKSGFLVDIAGTAIPAGISFYTFHQAAFLADTYVREKNVVNFLGSIRSFKNAFWAFCRYGAFVSFFPQLIIGPITYLREFHPQVKSRNFGEFNPIDLAVGFSFISIGMFKKVVIADNLAPTVDVVFGAAQEGAVIHPVHAWIGALSYVAQLYFDFSGYSDMALGLARMFGLRYPVNFYSPLKATGVVDYYRRWHMTLTRVIARFLYTPLSVAGTRYSMRNRLSSRSTRLLSLWLPMIVNFQIIGLWHGALWTFVAFGFMHGFWYALEVDVRATKRYKHLRKTLAPSIRILIERAMFFVPLCLSLAMFRSESVSGCLHLYAQMLGASLSAPPTLEEMRYSVLMLFLAFFIIYCLPNSVELMRRYRPALMTYENESYGFAFLRNTWRPTWAWAVFAAVVTVFSLYYVSRQPPFLYQGF